MFLGLSSWRAFVSLEMSEGSTEQGRFNPHEHLTALALWGRIPAGSVVLLRCLINTSLKPPAAFPLLENQQLLVLLSLSSAWMKLKVVLGKKLFIQAFLTLTDFPLSQAPLFHTFPVAAESAGPSSGRRQACAALPPVFTVNLLLCWKIVPSKSCFSLSLLSLTVDKIILPNLMALHKYRCLCGEQ